MKRGAPLNQQGKLPVTSPHPADISTLEEGSYDKTQKANGTSYARATNYSNFYNNKSTSSSSSFGAVNGTFRAKAKAASMASSSMNRFVFSILTKISLDNMKMGLLILIVATILLSFLLPLALKIFLLIYAAIAFGIIGSLYLSKSVLECDDGTEEMRQVSDPIREGAEGFLSVQYSAIAKIALPLSILLILSYQFRPEMHLQGISQMGNMTLGIVSAAGFLVGAVCSAMAGYVSMWVAAQSNIRVASAGRRSYTEALVICFRGGAFSALLNLTLCVAGVATFYVFLYQMFCMNGMLVATHLPMLMVGVSVVVLVLLRVVIVVEVEFWIFFSNWICLESEQYGFGASFVALFMQLGGGIYTKAADVGADLVGKVENSVPEDDCRNPATIADLVGDMVGDCVGSSADVFESVAAEIIGAMILGSTLANEAGFDNGQAIKFMFFPLIVHAMDIVVSSIGISMVNVSKEANSNPMVQLQKGYRVAMTLAVVGFYFITKWLLDVEDGAWSSTSSFNFFLCGVTGMVCAYIIVLSTQYYTDYEYKPVQSISEASTTGHGTNIIVGVSVGMRATFIPTITVAISVLVAYHLGSSTGIGDGHNAGLFGTAVATMGMLSNAVYILSMNNFGPIADNAGGKNIRVDSYCSY
jgi:Inorganic pyrophosphatase